MIEKFAVGEIVGYVLPALGLVGKGKVAEIKESMTGNRLLYFVSLEEKHRDRAPFSVKDGKTRVAEKDKGTHRAFYDSTLERIKQ